MKVDQPGGPGTFEIPKWDPVSQKKVRDALLILASTLPDTNRMYGTKDDVDPVRFVIGAATGWGANPPKKALYLNIFPSRNDGSTIPFRDISLRLEQTGLCHENSGLLPLFSSRDRYSLPTACEKCRLL